MVDMVTLYVYLFVDVVSDLVATGPDGVIVMIYTPVSLVK